MNDGACGEGRCVSYRVEAQEQVPLEGLIESADLFITVVPEAIDDRDLNGDEDATDEVLLLSDRRTGTRLPIGVAPALGRAATRILDLPFEYPAVATEDDIAAFLEPEPLQGRGDLNGDDDEVDTILRVYRATTPVAEPIAGTMHLAVDAAPLINGRNLVIADGLVLVSFRRSGAGVTDGYASQHHVDRRRGRWPVGSSGDFGRWSSCCLQEHGSQLGRGQSSHHVDVHARPAAVAHRAHRVGVADRGRRCSGDEPEPVAGWPLGRAHGRGDERQHTGLHLRP